MRLRCRHVLLATGVITAAAFAAATTGDSLMDGFNRVEVASVADLVTRRVGHDVDRMEGRRGHSKIQPLSILASRVHAFEPEPVPAHDRRARGFVPDT